MHNHKFEPSNLLNKRLAVIPDTANWAGDVEVFKSATGQDQLRYEEKHKKARQFTSKAMWIVAGNEAVKSSDLTGGLQRRRLTVRFDNQVGDNEKRDLLSFNDKNKPIGEFAPYLLGFLKWVLEMDWDEVEQVIRQPGKVAPILNDQAFDNLIETNPLMAWITDWCEFDPSYEWKVGGLSNTFGGTQDLTQVGMYANYAAWCQANGQKLMNATRFSNSVVDLCKNQLRRDVAKLPRRKTGNYVRGIKPVFQGENYS